MYISRIANLEGRDAFEILIHRKKERRLSYSAFVNHHPKHKENSNTSNQALSVRKAELKEL